MTKKGKRYSEQFKRETVRLVTEENYSVTDAALATGASHASISKWVQKSTGETATKVETIYESEKDELKALRAEVRRLRMEHEILKKAAAFFASDQLPGSDS